mmetsp:Transcript_153505/g.272236  ORF Transcript_153505/g.272236 Transcript_153505/m.272236 type:complete len:424 (+) Transcript_153505:147-1418(+)
MEKEPEQETVKADELLKLVIRNALTGDAQDLEICSSSTLRDLQVLLHKSFNIPPFEQVLLHEDGNTVLGDHRFDDTRPIGSMPNLSSGITLMIARKVDTRPQAEKNCAFMEALREGKLDEAMNVLDSSGVPVDPNCFGSFRHEGRGFLAGGPGARDFGDIRSAKTPALCMAVMARCRWSPAGEVIGELANESVKSIDASVVRVVERLLAMGASLDISEDEVLTCGSWPEQTVNKTALYLAVQTRSCALVRLLLDAGADPTKGKRECQFHPGKCMPCQSALLKGYKRQADKWDDAVTEELRSLLRRNEYEVKISDVDAASSTMGIKVSRRDGYWGFIDEIETSGLIARWNQHQSDDRQVKVGDKIVAVCGHRAGIDCRKGTGFLIDEARGWKSPDGDSQADCFLAHLLSKPQSEMVLTLDRTAR